MGSLMLLMFSTGCDLANISLGSVDLEQFDASEVVTQEIPYSGEHIVLENLLGKIAVEGVETSVRPILLLEAVKKVRGIQLEEVQVLISRGPGEIRIRSDLPSQVRRNVKLFPPQIKDEIGWVEFVLKVPQDAELDLDQRVGMIQISGFRGDVQVSAQLGDIVLDRSTLTTLSLVSQAGSIYVSHTTADEITLSAQFGELELSNVTFTSARLSTEAGSLAMAKSQGQRLNASTQAGSIAISASNLEGVDLETQAGSIELQVSGLKEGKLSTEFGGIRVELPKSTVSLQVEASTQLGGIKLFGLGLESGVQPKWSGSWPGRNLSFRLGDAPGVLELSTQLGSIEIRFTQ